MVEEAGEIKPLEKSTGKPLREVEDISLDDVMSGAHRLISFAILFQGLMKGEASGMDAKEPQLEVGGRDQSSSDVEELRRMLAVERVQVENRE